MPANLSSLDISGNHLGDISRLGCGVLVNALAQTVDVGRATVGRTFRLPLASVTGQTIQLGRSSAWTSAGPSITYTKAGTHQVPFIGASPPECSEVQLSGTVTQVAAPLQLMRPPRDR